VINTFFVGTVGIALAGAALTRSEPAEAQSKAADNPAQQQPVVQAAGEKLDGTVFHAQVLLDRAGFSPGVIDGLKGTSFEYAVRGFQEARGLQVTGELDNPTRQALLRDKAPSVRRLRIDQSDAQGPFTQIPKEPEDQAKMKRLAYRNLPREDRGEVPHHAGHAHRAQQPFDGASRGHRPAPAERASGLAQL
jgi:peptidoglycan hydrolase-like protein with peptidoglycan-binding domain